MRARPPAVGRQGHSALELRLEKENAARYGAAFAQSASVKS